MAKKPADLEKAEAKAEEKLGTSKVSVYFLAQNGDRQFVRTYSVEEHGEGFMELAKMFQGKVEGQIATGQRRGISQVVLVKA